MDLSQAVSIQVMEIWLNGRDLTFEPVTKTVADKHDRSCGCQGKEEEEVAGLRT